MEGLFVKLAFLYAGQGTQHVGMGRDLYEAYPEFRAVFDAPELDFDLKALCFDGPEELLGQTQYTQPCMVAFAAGLTAVLASRGIRPQMAAGLSLGEYSALTCAGVLDPKTAVELAAFRGRAMAQAVQGRPCSMLAILSLGREEVARCCREASQSGVVEIANYNCPTQIVIAGDALAVEQAGALAQQAGAGRVVPLKVSGPFHTSLMAPAGDALAKRFKTVTFHPMEVPVLFNCKGGPMEPGDTIPSLLVRQVQSSVYLEDTIHAMAAQGVDTIVEIGPGKALSSFVKKTERGLRTFAVETAEDVEALAAALEGA